MTSVFRISKVSLVSVFLIVFLLFALQFYTSMSTDFSVPSGFRKESESKNLNILFLGDSLTEGYCHSGTVMAPYSIETVKKLEEDGYIVNSANLGKMQLKQ